MGSVAPESLRLSPAEKKLYALLPRSERTRLSTTDLIDLYYGRTPHPFNARMILSARLKSLDAKLKRGEGGNLVKSERAGPYPIQVWLDCPRANGRGKKAAGRTKRPARKRGKRVQAG